MANFTPNLNLKKPLQTENYDVDDFNGNADIIDTQIGNLKKIALGAVEDLAALKAIDTTNLPDNITVIVKTLGFYRFDKTSTLTPNGTSIVQPTAGPGRWLNDLAAHLAETVTHVPYAVDTGVANVYVAILSPAPAAYIDGMALAVKITNASTAASTINVNSLGAKAIKKANGTDVTNLKAGGIYTLRYNATSENFILQGEGASGNATASDLLSGKTATTDAGEITGSMPNKVGSATVITPSTADQTIPQGYYGGAVGDGKVVAVNVPVANVLTGTTIAGAAGTMPNRGAVTITPSTANQAIAAGYHNGSGYVVGDPDFVAGNIKNGVNIFGVAGTAKVIDNNSTIITLTSAGTLTTSGTDQQTLYTCTVSVAGIYRVSFTLGGTSSPPGGQILAGSTWGTERWGAGTYTEDFSVSAGDSIQWKAKSNTVGTYATLSNLKIGQVG